MKHITCELPLKFTSKQGSYWKLKNYRLFWATFELCGLEIGYLAAVSAVGVTYLACIWYSIILQAQHSLGCPREKRRFEKSSALSTESNWRTIDLKRIKISSVDPDPYSIYGSGSGSTVPVEYGSGSRIRIHNTDRFDTDPEPTFHYDADPDPTQVLNM